MERDNDAKGDKMTGYRIPWVPILSEADLPDVEEGLLVTTNGGDVYSDWRNEDGEWEYASQYPETTIIAWAPLPAPYDPDKTKPLGYHDVAEYYKEPEPVDPRDALAALLAACEAAMAQCGELCQGYDGWQTQMREAVAKAREAIA